MEVHVGDIVQVVDSEMTYASATDFMLNFGTKEDCLKFRKGKKPEDGFLGKVCYLDETKKKAIITDKESAYVVEVNGLKNTTRAKFTTIHDLYEYAVKHRMEKVPFGVCISNVDGDEMIAVMSLENVEDGVYLENGENGKVVKDRFIWLYLDAE